MVAGDRAAIRVCSHLVGEERRGEEGVLGIIGKVGVFSKTCGCK